MGLMVNAQPPPPPQPPQQQIRPSRPRRPRDTLPLPSSPAPSFDAPSCFACAPMAQSNNTSTLITPSFKQTTTTTTASPSTYPSPSLSPAEQRDNRDHRRTSTLLPRGTSSLRRRILRPVVTSPNGTAKSNTAQAPPVSFTLSLDHPHDVSPSLTPPSPDPSATATSTLATSQPPPSAFRSRFRASRRSSAPADHDNNNSNAGSKSSIHKAAAERILKGHRKPPIPPTAPLPLLATLMATMADGGGGGSDAAAPLAPPPSSNGQPTDDLAPQGSERQTASPSTLAPIDVREALSKCDDPSMSWSLQFWVTIADPLVSIVPRPRRIPRRDCIDAIQTNDVFFACPASGRSRHVDVVVAVHS